MRVSHADATFPGRSGLIVFASNKSGHWAIFTMRADGSHRQKVTEPPAAVNDGAPAFAPNGKTIAFYRYKAGSDGLPVHGAIFTIDATGSHLHQLTHTKASVVDGDPAFSSDGEKLVFERLNISGGTSVRGQIFELDANGSHLHQLTHTKSYVVDEDPALSPNGKEIAFERNGNLLTMRADGSHVHRLTHFGPNGPAYRHPSYAPDGKRIAVDKSPPMSAGIFDIFTVDANGSHPHQLTHTASDREPVYSPNGKKIAFVGVNDAIFTMSADGTHRHQLTHMRSGVFGLEPDWQRLPKH